MIAKNKTNLFIEANPLLDENPSGISKLLFSMVDALSSNKEFNKKYTIVLFVPFNKKHLLNRWRLPAAIKVKSLPLPLRVINGLNKRHLMFPIDVLLGRGTYLFPNYRTLPLLMSKSVTYIHDVAYAKHPDTLLDINRVFLEHTIPKSVMSSDIILTLSEQSKKELVEIFPTFQDKIEVVPAGVDRALYTTRDGDNRSSRLLESLGVLDNQYILFVGNIEPRKNIAYLLDVFVGLVDHGVVTPEVALLLVGGGGWNNEGLMRRIKTLQKSGYNIVRPSMRISDEDLPLVYKHSALTTLLSIHEGFGMTPLEALASGSRVVVSDIPVLHEVCGESVNYAPLSSKEAAIKVFEAALTRPLNKRYSEEVLDKYSWGNAAEIFRKKLIATDLNNGKKVL